VTDLHAWITQQVDETERLARQAAPGPWAVRPFVYGAPGDGYGPPADFEITDAHGAEIVDHLAYEGGGIHHGPTADHVARHDPDAVLRRCEADRRILARHNVDPAKATWSDATACAGCGTYGDCDWPVTDNLNDCPELLDLAHAYGITGEILAGLDRPQPPEPKGASRPRPRTPMVDVPPALRGPHWKAHR
jgi:hypothetical protein